MKATDFASLRPDPQISPLKGTTRANERREVDRMRAEIDRLHREISDCQNALLNSNEHADLLQEHFYRVSASLTAESFWAIAEKCR